MTIIGLKFSRRVHVRKGVSSSEWQIRRGRTVIGRGRTRIGAAWNYVTQVVDSFYHTDKSK